MEKINWYEENIEAPLRDIIKYLRNNGINTECSCGHEMYIQCQYIPDGNISELHKILYNYFSKNKLNINYDLNIIVKVENGYTTLSSIDIRLKK